MKDHFIHYLPRKINIRSVYDKDDIFYAENQDPKDGFERPLYHITRRQSGPTRKIKRGSIIWLFSSINSPWGSLPISLDAKFVVKKVESLKDGRIKFHSSKKSKWFHLVDASEIIDNLKTIDSNGKINKLRTDSTKHLGTYLQSIRKLNNSEELIKWSDRIVKSEFHFISYRIKDGTEAAFQKTKSLLKDRKIVFWDRFCLPRRLAERREIVDNHALDNYLIKKLSKASWVWGIESPKYCELNSYSLKEALLAKKLKTYHSVIVE